MTRWNRGARLPLGTKRFLFVGKRTVSVTPLQAQAHMHVLGKTGSGKSYFLAGLFLAMYEARMPGSLIDPHGDLAELRLTHLGQRGEFAHRSADVRLVCLDLPTAWRAGRYRPVHHL